MATLLSQEDLSWRVRGSHDVRALHGRIERLLRQLECNGPIYSIRVEGSDVVRTHAAWREFAQDDPVEEDGAAQGPTETHGTFYLTLTPRANADRLKGWH